MRLLRWRSSLAVRSLGRVTDKQIASQPQRMLVLGSEPAFVLLSSQAAHAAYLIFPHAVAGILD
jgi:hypothetical protein